MQDSVLERGYRRHAFPCHRRGQTAAEGGERVFPEVVAVIEADSLEKQADLDVLELGLRAF